MATFPRSEDDILVLAQAMVNGFSAHPEIYPAPPKPGPALMVLLNNALAAIDAEREAYAASEADTTEKKLRFAQLSQAMRDDLRYAEIAVEMNDEKLKRLGWSAHKKDAPLEPPGQAMALVIASQGPGHLKLVWERPIKGGVVASYQIRRRHVGESVWHVAGLSLIAEANLEAQERNVELEYCVAAVNASGEGLASNIVMAVL